MHFDRLSVTIVGFLILFATYTAVSLSLSKTLECYKSTSTAQCDNGGISYSIRYLCCCQSELVEDIGILQKHFDRLSVTIVEFLVLFTTCTVVSLSLSKTRHLFHTQCNFLNILLIYPNLHQLMLVFFFYSNLLFSFQLQ